MREISGFPQDYTIFDLETTGFSRQQDKIIEIAALRVRNGEITDRFSSLVNPKVHIKEEIVNVTHIDDDMVKDAPLIGDVLKDFIAFVGNDVLIGHNIQVFDLKFVEREAKAIGQELANDFIDTLHVAKKAALKGEKFEKNSLEAIAEYYKISCEGNHRALKDCEINYEIYNRFSNLLKKNGKKEFIGEENMENEGKFYLYITGPKWIKYNHFKERVSFFVSNKKEVVLVTDNVGTIGEYIIRLAKENGYERVVIRGEWLTEGREARTNRDKKIAAFLKEQKGAVLTFWDKKYAEFRYLVNLCYKNEIPIKATK